ncbi:MAG TPA: Gfo/Idh/MocA family oxidoreductase [Candidatus Limnocylindrales bacterium]|nr:Gfo/Idh/MocA family oxidoreductase [Candidatus Limnocylindrales bacterium]
MAQTRIAVVGAGLIGLAHVDALRRSRTCALSAVVDPAPSAASVAGQAGVPWYRSLDDLFAAGLPDGVVLATPNQLHLEHALRCIAAGVPMLLEKPIAATVAEAEQVVSASEAAGVRVLIGHHRAHSPIVARAREVVGSGRIGRLVAITGSATFLKPDGYFADTPWRREAGGGPILINMIHEVHSLRMLCGEIVAVQAFASNAVRGFEVEDSAAINLRFESGALGSFMLSDTAASPRSWEQTSRENPSYPSYPDEDCYVVAGTAGSLSVPTMRLRTYPREADPSWWTPFEVEVLDVAREDPLQLQMEHFGAVARGEVPPLVTARDGLANLRVVEAIAKAARTGRTVEPG